MSYAGSVVVTLNQSVAMPDGKFYSAIYGKMISKEDVIWVGDLSFNKDKIVSICRCTSDSLLVSGGSIYKFDE